MHWSIGPSILLFCAFSWLFSACASTTPAPAARTQKPPARTVEGVLPSEPEGQAEAPSDLYGAEEALRDTLSGTLVHIGTGTWPGDGRMPACAFKNERVVVVLAYCSPEESQAFRVQVYSPTRGRVLVYAESKTPLSAHRRPQYFTFTAQSEPPPGPEANVAAVQLEDVSFFKLQQYEEQRYAAYLPACYGGVEHGRSQSGCLGPLASHSSSWSQRHSEFLARANSDWYFVVGELRKLAMRYGRNPD